MTSSLKMGLATFCSISPHHLVRLSSPLRLQTLKISSISTSCCCLPNDDDKSLHLSPKPKPVPLPLTTSDEPPEQSYDERKRIMAFMENFQASPTPDSSAPPRADDQPLPDPASDKFREEMRARLLYTDPPPLPEESEGEDEEVEHPKQNIEFDMFEHLVLTIRHILHLKYRVGERLEEQDEQILLEEAIPYHPDRDFKVGVGIEYIKVNVHPDFGSRCFFIVRKDKSEIDFSYRKCMMGLAEAKPYLSTRRARNLIYFFKSSRKRSRLDDLLI